MLGASMFSFNEETFFLGNVSYFSLQDPTFAVERNQSQAFVPKNMKINICHYSFASLILRRGSFARDYVTFEFLKGTQT